MKSIRWAALMALGGLLRAGAGRGVVRLNRAARRANVEAQDDGPGLCDTCGMTWLDHNGMGPFATKAAGLARGGPAVVGEVPGGVAHVRGWCPPHLGG